MNSRVDKCQNCGYDLTDFDKTKPDDTHERQCPECGEPIKKNIFISTSFRGKSSHTHISKFKDKTGFDKLKSTYREGNAVKTGQPNKTTITVDKMNPDITLTSQYVEEKKDGVFLPVHRHVKVGKAKHRPKEK